MRRVAFARRMPGGRTGRMQEREREMMIMMVAFDRVVGEFKEEHTVGRGVIVEERSE